MRLICTFDDQQQAYTFSTFLKQNGIENQLEIDVSRDWSSHEYGVPACKIWAIDEDQFEAALQFAEEFKSDPLNPRFAIKPNQIPPQIVVENVTSQTGDSPQTPISKMREPMGAITRYLLLICTFLLVSAALSSPTVPAKIPAYLNPTPVYSPPINKALMFDYPEAFQLEDKLIETYGLENLVKPDSLPAEARKLIVQIENTPYWQGVYPKIVEHFQNPDAQWTFNTPMFEKIKQGEYWRLFTPCLLHNDLLHLFFNMIWLVVLGKQIEARMGKARYILFIVIVAIITNIAQYLMSGPNFLGFSGVLMGMVTYIWRRQRQAAWEGYQLEKGTFNFIAFFILFLVTLQIISFFLETQTKTTLPIGIANTAHLTGGIMGIILAGFKFFSWRQKSI